MDTVVIEIRADYRDNTKGMSKSIDGMDKFSRSIDKTKQQLDKAASSTENWYEKIKRVAGKTISIPVKILDHATRPLRSLYNFATSLRGVLTGIMVGQVGSTLVKAPVSLADQLESATMFFERKLGSVQEAQKFLQEIYKFDEKSPFDTMQIIDITKSMMGVGWTRDNVLKDIGTIGDFSASMGLGTEGVERISRQLGQMRMKSKLSQEEINVLNEVGLNAWQYIADAMGVDVKTARALNEKKGSAINGEDAVKWILAGIEREYGGAANSASDRTLSGIIDQMKSMLQTKVALKWGQGLAEGAKTGFGALKEMLEENDATIVKFGETLQKVGTELSTWVFDKANNALTRLKETIDSDEFKEADLGEKIKLVWDNVVVEPFNTWWDGPGGEKVRKKAEEIGTSVGEWIGNGLAKAFGQIIPNLFNNASKLIPGGERANGSSWLSAAVLGYGAKSLGLGKLAGWGLSKLGGATAAGGAAAAGAAGGAAAAGTATGIGLTAATASGWIGAGVGLLSAAADLKSASEAMNKQNKKEYTAQGWTKVGMTVLGGLLGTLIAPGAGTAIGAGLGGAAATMFGGQLGTTIMHHIDGTAEIDAAVEKVNAAVETYNEAKQAFETGNGLLTVYESANKTVTELEKVNAEYDKITGRTAETEKIKEQWDALNTAIKKGLFKGDELTAAEAKISELESKLVTLYPELKGQIDLQGKGWDSISTKIGKINDTDMENFKKKYGDIETLEAELQTALGERSTAIQGLSDQYDGYITKYEEEHGLLDTTLAKLQQINREERERARYALTDLRQTVFETEPQKEELEKRILDAEAEAAKDEAIAKANADAKAAVDALYQKYRETDNPDAVMEVVEAELKKIQEEYDAVYAKYGELAGARIYDPDNVAASLEDFYGYKDIWGNEHSTALALNEEGAKYNAGIAENRAAADADRKPYSDLYGAKRLLIEENDMGKYSGTYSDLMSKWNSGEIGVLAELLAMVDEIKQMEGTFAALNESQKFNTADFWNQVIEGVDAQQLFKHVGWDKVAEPQTEADMLYNSIVDQKNEESNAYFQEMVELLRTLNENSTPEEIKQGQQFITDTLGEEYLPKKGVDGSWGKETSKAIESFFAALDSGLATVDKWRKNNDTMTEKGFATDGSGLLMKLFGLKSPTSATDTPIDGNLAADGVQNFIKNGLQTDTVGSATSDMSDSIMSASTSNGVLAEGANAAGASAKSAADNIQSAGTNAGNTANSLIDLGAKSGTSSGQIDTLGTASDAAKGSIFDLSANAGTAAGSMYGASSYGILAGINMLRVSAGASNVANALYEKAGQIRSVAFPTASAKAEGDILTGPEFILAGEDGDEAIIPLSRKHRRRGLALFKEAARRMGIPMMAKGGVVTSSGDAGDAPINAAMSVSSGGVNVSLGGVNFTIQTSSGDSEGIISAIRANMPSIANEVADAIAAALEQTYSNMATTGV